MPWTLIGDADGFQLELGSYADKNETYYIHKDRSSSAKDCLVKMERIINTLRRGTFPTYFREIAV